MHIYKFDFTIKVSCKSIKSYAKAHISIPANSKEEATKILRENSNITYARIYD